MKRRSAGPDTEEAEALAAGSVVERSSAKGPVLRPQIHSCVHLTAKGNQSPVSVTATLCKTAALTLPDGVMDSGCPQRGVLQTTASSWLF